VLRPGHGRGAGGGRGRHLPRIFATTNRPLTTRSTNSDCSAPGLLPLPAHPLPSCSAGAGGLMTRFQTESRSEVLGGAVPAPTLTRPPDPRWPAPAPYPDASAPDPLHRGARPRFLPAQPARLIAPSPFSPPTSPSPPPPAQMLPAAGRAPSAPAPREGGRRTAASGSAHLAATAPPPCGTGAPSHRR
jgi:hypothetical protein